MDIFSWKVPTSTSCPLIVHFFWSAQFFIYTLQRQYCFRGNSKYTSLPLDQTSSAAFLQFSIRNKFLTHNDHSICGSTDRFSYKCHRLVRNCLSLCFYPSIKSYCFIVFICEKVASAINLDSNSLPCCRSSFPSLQSRVECGHSFLCWGWRQKPHSNQTQS